MRYARNAIVFAPAKATVDYILDGEVIMTLPVTEGRSRYGDYVIWLPVDADVRFSKGVEIVGTRIAAGIQPYGEGFTHSGANPDFRPTSASRVEKQMRLAIARMEAATGRIEAREAALARVERIPAGPVEVIEPEPAKPDDKGADAGK